MLLKNRLFERQAPSKSAKSIFIFCEGLKREYQYFNYFREIDSRINIEVYKLKPEENNSPLGLLEIAKACIFKTIDNPKPKYDFVSGDEVWIVLDTDLDRNYSRISQIHQVRAFCMSENGWNIAQSNPCFEVWLHYHFYKENDSSFDINKCSLWKSELNESIKGGFNSKKHPLHINTAAYNAWINFRQIQNNPTIGSTEVYMLANAIYPLIKNKLTKAISIIDKD